VPGVQLRNGRKRLGQSKSGADEASLLSVGWWAVFMRGGCYE
jgi:hypothetical protein